MEPPIEGKTKGIGMIYLGNFVHRTNLQDPSEFNRRHGEFILIVTAENSEDAIDLFRERIREARKSSELFEGDCKIYFTQLLEFDTFPETQAVLVNFKSTAGDPVMPFIGCTLPNKEQEVCRIYEWNDEGPSIDGRDEVLFAEFKAGDETCRNFSKSKD